MKKLLSLLIVLAFVSTLFVGIVAVAETSTPPKTTRDVVVDYNVFKGERNGKDVAVVWADVADNKYSAENEYGHFIYKATADDIDLSKGHFDVADAGKKSFAVSYDLSKLAKNVEYSVKAYVKTPDGEVKLSRTTACIKVTDGAVVEGFDIYTSGSKVVCAPQDPASFYGKNGNECNTQYYVYVNDVLIGASTNYDEDFAYMWDNESNKHLRYDFHSAIFSYDESTGEYDYDDGDYNVVVKTMSGLNNGGVSKTLTLKVKTINSAGALLAIGSNDESQSDVGTNTYYVLGKDIDVSGSTKEPCDFLNGTLSTTVENNGCHFIINKFFNDTLDGLGHKLTASYNNTESTKEFAGLFAKMGRTGAIKNLVYELDATYGYAQTKVNGEGNGLRACAVAYYTEGSLEDCFIYAKMNSTANNRREALFGQAYRNVHENVIFQTDLYTNGTKLTELQVSDSVHDDSTGGKYIWESLFKAELRNVVTVTAIPWQSGGFGGQGKHEYCTRYLSYDDLLNGTNGLIMDNQTVGVSLGSNRVNGKKIYQIGSWDEKIWNFENNAIEFFGKSLYQITNE